MNAKPDNDHRRFSRIPFVTQVIVRTPSQSGTADLLDVSLKGALLRLPSGWQGKIGDETDLELRIAEGVSIRMQTRLTHLEGDRAGYTCHHIDLESAEHLRRLVELNLGNDAQLHRELEAMIHLPTG